MVSAKGPALEELVRAYFSRQGFYVLRSVPYRFEGEEVTDLDAWMYGRQAPNVRIRGIVDVKNKKSPKAFERVLWIKGVQAAMGCDRATIATTDGGAHILKFAQLKGVSVLSKAFLDRLGKRLEPEPRMTLEEFLACVNLYAAHKQDGDWLRIVADTKSAVASVSGFAAFNKAMFAFKFFGERAEVRTQHKEQALRCALLTAGVACIALDVALEKSVFQEAQDRYANLLDGVTYGDNDGRVKASIEAALEAVAEGMANGRAIAAQARQQLDKRFASLRADVIAEYFMREPNAQHLYQVARELDNAAHAIGDIQSVRLSVEARSVLGVFSDFANVKRKALMLGSDDVDKASGTSNDKKKDVELAKPESLQNPLL